MRAVFFLIALSVAELCAGSADGARIVGGTQTVIEQYPFSVSLLHLRAGNNFRQLCGGNIINNRSVLTVAHCFDNRPANTWRMRVGSTNAHSGGVLHNINNIIIHPNYNRVNLDNDIAIVRSSTAFVFNQSVRPGSIAGANFYVPDNRNVWAIGWGATFFMGNQAEQLRHVQVRTVSQDECRRRYDIIPRTITDNMLCTGWLDIGGRGQCHGDSGSPVLLDNVIIGLTSWGEMCAQPHYPFISVRVSRFTSWIRSNS